MLRILNLFKSKRFLETPTSCIQRMSTAATASQSTFKKPKYDGRSKKRKWEERRSDKGAGIYPEKKICDEPYIRIKRRKYAMLLGYCGVDYYGMQRNPSTKTIEEDLFQALLKADLITQEAYEQIQTIQFQRAARTDKGVSAARQVVSIKLPEEVDISKANDLLPEVIKIFGLKRVTKGFNSKSQCDGRTYTYILPTVAFAKSDSTETQETFSLSEKARNEINEVLDNFKGTKNFHNFTCKKNPSDPSAKRYIISFECEPPIIRKGVEFTVLKVRGQSFMLHQIRKMVGLTIAVIKGYISMDTFNKAFTTEKLNIPRAPGLGLVLEKVHYDRYNFRYGADGIHETLEWTEADEEVDAFKEKYVYPVIIDSEINEKIMLGWLAKRLSMHKFDQIESDDEHSSDEENEDDCKTVDPELETNNANSSNKVDVNVIQSSNSNCEDSNVKLSN